MYALYAQTPIIISVIQQKEIPYIACRIVVATICKDKNEQVGNDQEKAHYERNSRGGENLIDNQVLILRKHIVRRVSSYFPNRRPFSNPNLNKHMKTYLRLKQQTNSTPKHKTNGTATEVSPWNDQ